MIIWCIIINNVCFAQNVDKSQNIMSELPSAKNNHAQVKDQPSQELINNILTVTGNTVDVANQYLTFSTYILAIFALALTALGVVLQIIGFRERKRYLIKIANNFSQDEDIQNTFVEKVLQSREIKESIRVSIDSAVRMEVARSVAEYISSKQYKETMQRLMGVIKDE